MTTFRSENRYAVIESDVLVGVAQRGDAHLSWVFVHQSHAEGLAELWVRGDHPTVESMCAEVQTEMRACGWVREAL